MHRSISIRSMLAVVPGVSNFIQTRVGHSTLVVSGPAKAVGSHLTLFAGPQS
jgi:hypothetical protein